MEHRSSQRLKPTIVPLTVNVAPRSGDVFHGGAFRARRRGTPCPQHPNKQLQLAHPGLFSYGPARDSRAAKTTLGRACAYQVGPWDRLHRS